MDLSGRSRSVRVRGPGDALKKYSVYRSTRLRTGYGKIHCQERCRCKFDEDWNDKLAGIIVRNINKLHSPCVVYGQSPNNPSSNNQSSNNQSPDHQAFGDQTNTSPPEKAGPGISVGPFAIERPPGLTKEGALRRDDEGGGSALHCCDSLMQNLHVPHSSARSVKARPKGDEFEGGATQCVGQFLPLADGIASSGWGPSMHVEVASLAHDAMLVVGRFKGSCGSSIENQDPLGKVPQQKILVHPTEQASKQKDEKEGPRIEIC